MKLIRFCSIAALVLLLTLPLQAQITAPADTNHWQFALLTNVSKFSFDGTYKLFDGPFAFGVEYDQESIDWGAFLSPSIVKIDETEVSVAIIGHVRIINKFGIGLGYEFWQSGTGIVKPKTQTVFFTIHYDVSGSFW